MENKVQNSIFFQLIFIVLIIIIDNEKLPNIHPDEVLKKKQITMHQNLK